MKKETNILIAEDNKEHLDLIRKNLLRADICNEMLAFADGKELLDFLFDMDKKAEHNSSEYILLLDIGMSKIDGVKVLKKIKQDAQLKKIPVIILTSADAPQIVEQCHTLGCSTYIVKPPERQDFEETIQKLGHFLSVVETTSINQ